MNATMYYDEALIIDPFRTAEQASIQLHALGIDARVTVKADPRLAGRGPLLVLDGGRIERADPRPAGVC